MVASPEARRSDVTTPRGLYRLAALAETITWSLLIVGLALKYGAGLDLAVTVSGGIHGFVFLAYAAIALLVGLNQRWRLWLIALAVASAVVPYATIPFERWLERSNHLSGGWRTEATADERDSGWLDRAVRWMLRHPALLLAVAVLAVVAVFAALLLAGPPGG